MFDNVSGDTRIGPLLKVGAVFMVEGLCSNTWCLCTFAVDTGRWILPEYEQAVRGQGLLQSRNEQLRQAFSPDGGWCNDGSTERDHDALMITSGG